MMNTPERLATYTTTRLTLRPFRLTDLAPLAAIQADPIAMRFKGNGATYDLPETRRYLNGLLGPGTQLVEIWAIALKETDVLIGRAGLYPPDVATWGDREIDYLIAREHWGKGYATEAAGELVRVCFAERGYQQIIALTRPENSASIRVLAKTGFQRQTTISNDFGDRLLFGNRRLTT
ncbi:MAG: GNAT family N-acetyltransferase [Anaerolineales bacterium]|nr:GNAT family N-acetyltransferase [Anaerolineales bacterium]MCB0005848.1 GNAT family N-acetyltransferase [Anaerolineales bacterium]